MWDLAENPNSIKLIESFLAAGKPVALVCHAPGVLRHVKTPARKPLVEGKNVTGFTDGEEGSWPDQGRPLPRRRRVARPRRHLLQGQELGRPCRHRRVANHRPEPGFVRTHRQGPDQRPKDQIGGPNNSHGGRWRLSFEICDERSSQHGIEAFVGRLGTSTSDNRRLAEPCVRPRRRCGNRRGARGRARGDRLGREPARYRHDRQGAVGPDQDQVGDRVPRLRRMPQLHPPVEQHQGSARRRGAAAALYRL